MSSSSRHTGETVREGPPARSSRSDRPPAAHPEAYADAQRPRLRWPDYPTLYTPLARACSRDVDADALRRVYSRHQWARQGTRLRRLLWLLLALGWPLTAVVLTIDSARRHGAMLRRIAGVSIVRQIRHQIVCAIAHDRPPIMYYEYGWHRPEQRRLAERFFAKHESIQLNDAALEGVDTGRLTNKIRFAEEASASRLPIVPLLYSFTDGVRRSWLSPDGSLPPRDLILKPASLASGAGVERIRFVLEANHYQTAAGDRLAASDVLAAAATRSVRGPYLLQPCLPNSLDMSVFSTGGLCTVRVVTFRMPAEEPEVALALLRMPTGDSVTDNFDSGGIAAPVDIPTGRLGPATSGLLFDRRYSRHPDTDAPIEGSVLPQWESVLDAAIQAHRAFIDFPTVGWDVALTREGVRLIEGNPYWSVQLAQKPTDQPLTATGYLRVIRAQIESRRRGASAESSAPVVESSR